MMDSSPDMDVQDWVAPLREKLVSIIDEVIDDMGWLYFHMWCAIPISKAIGRCRSTPTRMTGRSNSTGDGGLPRKFIGRRDTLGPEPVEHPTWDLGV